MDGMEVQGIVASRQRNKQREFLVKWRQLAEPVWQPESNYSLKPYFDHYFDMMNCTFEYFPALMGRQYHRVEVELDNAELAIKVKGKKVKDWRVIGVDQRRMVMEELEALCHHVVKKQKN